MFFRSITDDIKLSLSVPQYAEELFALTDKNREFLGRWLPWLDTVKKPSDTRDFLALQLLRFQQGEALHATIFYREKIAGVLGYNLVDPPNKTGHIGYWLAEEYNGRGIMCRSVKELIVLGLEYYTLNRFDIRCAVENNKSRAIPKRLGFKEEGVIRGEVKVNDVYLDHVVYGLLRGEFKPHGCIVGAR